MGKLIDLTGRKFGYWTVKGRGHTEPNHGGTRVFWVAECVCGAVREIQGVVLRDSRSSSCGCKTAETISAKRTTHGQAGKDTRSREYSSWNMMMNRCNNPNAIDWGYYGGRGIKVCYRWGRFENFLADMGTRPAGSSLDRYPNKNGNYKPGNCRWATAKQQMNNTRRNK